MYRFLDFGVTVVNFAKNTANTFLSSCNTTSIAESLQLSDAAKPAADAIISAITPVAWGFLLIVFCLDLMQKTYQDNFNIQQLIGPFAKLIAGVVAISMCQELADGLAVISNELTTTVGGADGINFGGNLNADALLAKMDEFLDVDSVSAISGVNGKISTGDLAVNMFGGLLLVVQLFPGFLCSKGLQIYLLITCLYRSIEFWLRCAFLPLACADLLHNGTASHGIRYCGKILGVGLQGAVITALMGICVNVAAGIGGFAGILGVSGGDLGPVGGLAAATSIGASMMTWMCLTCALCFFGIKFSKDISNAVFPS